MKTILLTLFLFLSTLQAQTAFRFYINNINMPMNNNGTLADVNIPPDGGLGRYLGVPFLFSGGFFLSGYNGDTLWANAQASASLIENYKPGNVGSNQYDPRYKIYVVKESDQPFGISWQEWIFAVVIGAEFYDGDNDGVYNQIDLNGNGEINGGIIHYGSQIDGNGSTTSITIVDGLFDQLNQSLPIIQNVVLQNAVSAQ